jgi:hypothetical protein
LITLLVATFTVICLDIVFLSLGWWVEQF